MNNHSFGGGADNEFMRANANTSLQFDSNQDIKEICDSRLLQVKKKDT